MKYTSIGVKINDIDQKLSEYWPLHNGIIVEPHKIRDETSGGIFVPDTVKEQATNTAEDDLAYKVLKVGPEAVNVQEGDFILMGQQTGYGLYLLDDSGKEVECYQVFENWVLGIFRPGVTDVKLKPSPAIVEMTTQGMKNLKVGN